MVKYLVSSDLHSVMGIEVDVVPTMAPWPALELDCPHRDKPLDLVPAGKHFLA